jgi:Synergist-CTERM protein sorting domain-containing protein
MDSGRNDGYPYLQWAEELFEEAGSSSSGCNSGIPGPLFLLLLSPLGLLWRKSR